jgi:hypothetical protein
MTDVRARQWAAVRQPGGQTLLAMLLALLVLLPARWLAGRWSLEEHQG